MLPPEHDIKDRLKVWEALEIFWLDTDYKIRLHHSAKTCAESKYSIEELEQIFFNEARPAFADNLLNVAGEWAGFDEKWIVQRVLKTHCFGAQGYARLPKFLSRFDGWENLKPLIEQNRKNVELCNE